MVERCREYFDQHLARTGDGNRQVHERSWMVAVGSWLEGAVGFGEREGLHRCRCRWGGRWGHQGWLRRCWEGSKPLKRQERGEVEKPYSLEKAGGYLREGCVRQAAVPVSGNSDRRRRTHFGPACHGLLAPSIRARQRRRRRRRRSDGRRAVAIPLLLGTKLHYRTAALRTTTSLTPTTFSTGCWKSPSYRSTTPGTV
jgi:hypothetical protein